MDCTQYITVAAERKKGQHLGREERGAIQYLKRHGLSNRAIARELGCSPNHRRKTSCAEAHRLVRATKADPPATLQSEERPFTRQIECVQSVITRYCPAPAF